MTTDQVLELLFWWRQNGITVWICGGWGVDALLGKQTREHDDLDIAVERKDNAKLRQLLENSDYREITRGDSSEFMYVMENEYGQSIDIHAFEYGENGNITYGVEFPFGALTGTGFIGGQEVKCVSPEWAFKFYNLYELREKDQQDQRALSKKFGFELPKGNRHAMSSKERDMANEKTTSPEGPQFLIKEGEPLKNMFNYDSLRKIALIFKSVYDPFPVEAFLESIIDETWDGLELKARGRKITLGLGKYLPPDYRDALAVLDKVVAKTTDFFGFFMPDFIEVYGQNEADWDVSISALERYTVYWSSEMAVRPFIISHEERMMARMYAWSKHEKAAISPFVSASASLLFCSVLTEEFIDFSMG